MNWIIRTRRDTYGEVSKKTNFGGQVQTYWMQSLSNVNLFPGSTNYAALKKHHIFSCLQRQARTSCLLHSPTLTKRVIWYCWYASSLVPRPVICLIADSYHVLPCSTSIFKLVPRQSRGKLWKLQNTLLVNVSTKMCYNRADHLYRNLSQQLCSERARPANELFSYTVHVATFCKY